MTITSQSGDLDIAREMLSSDDFIEGHIGVDCDEHIGDEKPSEPGTVTLHLNGEVARMLLDARRWQRGTDGAIYAPDGDSRHWDIAEALTLALTAEVV